MTAAFREDHGYPCRYTLTKRVNAARAVLEKA